MDDHGAKVYLKVFFLLFLAGHLVRTEDDGVDIVRDRCTRWHHSSMLRDKSVFVDGGVQLYRKNGTTWLGFSKYIFEIDMSTPWDATINFTEKRIGRFGNSAMGANPPNMVRGALYRGLAQDRKLFTFGGSTFLANQSDPDWKQPDSDEYSLWSYDTEAMTWDQYDITHAVTRRPNWGAAAEAISLGIAFFLNGQVDRGSSSVLYSMTEYINGTLTNETNDQITYLGGMVIIDLATQIARNVSTDTLGAPRIAGGLVHGLKFGKTRNGTLVTFGGMRSANEKNNTFNNGILIDFNTVSLCDTFNEADVIWFNQSTSGDTPPPRIDFCVLPGVKSAKDNSSHNIYIYGGYDPTQSIIYDDVYVLSLPSFSWTKVYSGNNPKFGHTCHTAGGRQMMTVGGSLDGNMYAVETTGKLPNLSTLNCDRWGGVALFDLSNLTWGSFFDAYAPEYQIPKKVVDVIGGSADGGATIHEPVSGFAHLAISTMFNPPLTASTPPPTNLPTLAPRPKDNNNGHIVGAVIGSVAGIILIVGLVVWAIRRRRRALHPHELHGESAQETRDITYKCQELPADVQPVRQNQHAAELQGESKDNGELVSPVELPAEGFFGNRSK